MGAYFKNVYCEIVLEKIMARLKTNQNKTNLQNNWLTSCFRTFYCWKRGLNRLHVCLTIIRAHFIGIPGPQQRWETRNTEHLCAFHLLRKSVNHKNTTVKSETETQQQKNKNKKKPLINLKVEELHLDGHTQNTPQPQEIQNNGTATSCSRRTFYRFTCVITLAGCWENTLSILLSENKL